MPTPPVSRDPARGGAQADTPPGIRFEYLGDHMDLARAIAHSHVEAFGTLLRDWTVDGAEQELRTHTGHRCIPTTLIAMEGEQWLGTVSLLQNDDERIRQYSPWLASLVVRASARGRGIGRALVARCVEEADALGVRTLYLYCEPALLPFYRGLGWREHDLLMLGPVQVIVMAWDCATVPESSGFQEAR